jgi:exonuclease SbcC
MRPIRLSFEGLTSFASRQTLDFEKLNLDLFAITGPKGAGKSSILDAICLVLYDKSSRGLNPIYRIRPGCNQLKIELEFRVDGERYQVQRVWARKKDAVSNKLSVLRYFNDGEWEIIADTYKVVNETIVQLLKLKYDDFTRTVVLPQGKFDEFLNGNNAKRRELLKKLAGLEILDKMKAIADEKEAETGKRLAEIKGSLSVLTVAEPEMISNWKQELKHYQAELPKLKESQNLASNRLSLLNNLIEKQNKLDIAQKDLNELNEQSEMIFQARANLIKIDAAEEIHPLKVQLDGYRNQLLEAKNSIAELEQTLQLAEHKTQDTEIKLREIELVKPDVKRLELLEDKLTEITTLSSVTNSLVKAQNDLKSKQEDWKVIQAELSRLTLELDEAQKGYSEALKFNQAALIREHLHEGDSCPVCGGIYHSQNNRVSQSQKAENDLKLALDKVSEKHRNAQVRYSILHSEIEGLSNIIGDSESQSVALLEGLTNIEYLTSLSEDERLNKLEKLKRETVKLRQATRDFHAKYLELNQIMADAKNEQTTALTRLQTKQEQIQEIDEKLCQSIQSWEKVLEEKGWSEGDFHSAYTLIPQRKQLAEKVKDFDTKQLVLAERISNLKSDLADKTVDVQEFENIRREVNEMDNKIESVRQLIFNLESRLQKDAEDRLKKRDLENKLKQTQVEYDDYATLKKHLQPAQFLTDILNKFEAELLQNASVHLYNLSDGQFQFRLGEGGYEIIDSHCGDDVRPVSSLSGGETFQASLALALALSERFNRGRNQEFLFIDEGFSSVGVNDLDRVVDTLIGFKMGGQMIGVISHVPEIAERIGREIQVIKKATGSDIKIY